MSGWFLAVSAVHVYVSCACVTPIVFTFPYTSIILQKKFCVPYMLLPPVQALQPAAILLLYTVPGTVRRVLHWPGTSMTARTMKAGIVRYYSTKKKEEHSIWYSSAVERLPLLPVFFVILWICMSVYCLTFD